MFTTCFTPAFTLLAPLLVAWWAHKKNAQFRRARGLTLVVLVWAIALVPLWWALLETAVYAAQAQPYSLAISAPVVYGQPDSSAAPGETAVSGSKPLKISWYDPALGGINCDHDCSTMASGVKVTPDRYGITAACIAQWTRARRVVVIPGVGRFECLDTGGAIQEHPGYIWIDLMLAAPAVPFGTLVYDWYLE